MGGPPRVGAWAFHPRPGAADLLSRFPPRSPPGGADGAAPPLSGSRRFSLRRKGRRVGLSFSNALDYNRLHSSKKAFTCGVGAGAFLRESCGMEPGGAGGLPEPRRSAPAAPRFHFPAPIRVLPVAPVPFFPFAFATATKTAKSRRLLC